MGEPLVGKYAICCGFMDSQYPWPMKRLSVLLIGCALLVQPPSVAASDRYADAQTSLSYTVFKPAKTLGLSTSKFELAPCANQTEPFVYAKFGGSVRYMEIIQSKAGVRCSDPGVSKKLRNVTINGSSAQVHVYCDPAKAASFAKCTSADITRVGGYLLFTNKGAKSLSATQIQVQGFGGVAYSQLLDVARSLTAVKASGTPSPAPTSSDLVLATPAYTPSPSAGSSDEYRCFLLDPKFTIDSYLQSVTITPDNLKVSHHGILYRVPAASVATTKEIDAQNSGDGWPCFGDTGIPGASAFSGASASSWISFWAPGGNFKAYPAGVGMKISPADQFIVQAHFHTFEPVTAQKASMKVSLKLATTAVAELKTMLVAAPIEIACAPNESGPLCVRSAALLDLAKRTSTKTAFQETALLIACGKDPLKPIPSPTSDCTNTVRSPMKIYGATGHMHQLGRSITITHQSAATSAVTVLSSRPMWDFDNQTTDWQSTPIVAKPGDTVKVTCTFDIGLRALLPVYKNLSPNYVVWGEGTRDEMCLAIVNYTD